MCSVSTRSSLDRLNQGWADLIWLAQSGKRHEVSIADSLWLRDGFPFRPAFLDTNRDYFAAELRPLPSDPATAAKDINAWVEEHTAGRIKDIVTPDSFDAQTILALFNTVHLKVKWDYFDKKDTRPAPFTLASGEQVEVPMMNAADLEAPVAQTASYDAVALKTDGPVTVWVIVPKGSETAESLLKGLDARQLEALYGEATTATGSLELPRFTTKYTADQLKENLAAMGMPRAFSPDAGGVPRHRRRGARAHLHPEGRAEDLPRPQRGGRGGGRRLGSHRGLDEHAGEPVPDPRRSPVPARADRERDAGAAVHGAHPRPAVTSSAFDPVPSRGAEPVLSRGAEPRRGAPRTGLRA